MKILFITQLLPYPPRTGGKVKSYSILKLLAKKHSIQVISFHDKKINQKDALALEKLLNIKVKSFYQPIVTAPSKNIKRVALKSLFSTKPFRVWKYFSEEMAKYISDLTRKQQFEVIYIDHNTSFQYLKYVNRKPNSKVVFDEHNINSIAMWRNAKETRRKLAVRIFSLLDVLKNYFYERKIVSTVDWVLAISEPDRILLLNRGANPHQTKVLPVPFIVNNRFKFKSNNPTILLVGLLSWAPNKFGVLWFYERIYPIIRQVIPNIKLLLVGPRPEEEILALGKYDQSVTVTGEVPSLVPYYQKASVLVVPILSGSGIRIKILHALAAGIPVVSTKIGAEGLIKTKNNGILHLDSKSNEAFAQAVIEVITHPKLAKKLNTQGLTTIKQYYSAQTTQKVLTSIGL